MCEVDKLKYKQLETISKGLAVCEYTLTLDGVIQPIQNVWLHRQQNITTIYGNVFIQRLLDLHILKMVKRCAWGTCKSDSRCPTRLQKDDGTSVSFYSFPSLKKSRERREIWIRACCRGDAFVCRKDSYICGFHFIGGNGPTEEYPDPIYTRYSRCK